MENKIHENLSSELIIQIYKLGIFPMAKNRFDSKIYFVNPKKRALLPIKDFHVSKSFSRFIKKKPFLSINIESESGFKNLDKILKIAKNSINNITVGRSDFSKSYFNPKINQNSFFITKKIIEIAVQAKKNKLYTTVGGGVDEETIKTYKKNKQIFNAKKKFYSYFLSGNKCTSNFYIRNKYFKCWRK